MTDTPNIMGPHDWNPDTEGNWIVFTNDHQYIGVWTLRTRDAEPQLIARLTADRALGLALGLARAVEELGALRALVDMIESIIPDDDGGGG